jgi:Pvc16 N-terminal domain
MIEKSLSLIASQLNQHLRRSFHSCEDLVILSNLMQQDGSPASLSNNKMVLFLAGIEPSDTVHPVLGEAAKDLTQCGSLGIAKWNLLVMCAANCSGGNYPEALKFLTSTIQFIQEHPVLNRENAPSFDPLLDKLLLSIEHMPASETNSLWNIHNDGHYLPSVICRVQVFGSLSGGHSEHIDA